MDETKSNLPAPPAAALVPAVGAQALVFDKHVLAGQLAPSSIAMYLRDAGAYLAFADPENTGVALDPTMLVRWRTHLVETTTHSPRTINRMLSAVKRFVREAASHGYVARSVAEGFDAVEGVSVKAMKQRLKKDNRTKITPADMRRLCDAPNIPNPHQHPLVALRDVAMLHTMASSGLRVSEIATLTTTQITRRDGHYFIVVQGKNDIEPREAPLSAHAYTAIQSWLHTRPVPSAYIFTSFEGFSGPDKPPRLTDRHIKPPSIWKAVQGYATAVGLAHIKPHDFRRFVGTQLAKKDIRKAQKALGHKDISTTAAHYVLDELEGGLTDGLY